MSFDSLQIDPRCRAILSARGITEPTPIQARAIPVALRGDDLIAIAQTGTGKTLAFGLPAMSRLAALPRGTTGMLVLTPTRELAQQIHDVLKPLAQAVGLTITTVYGGVGMEPQAQALRRGASIVVACPGRLLDHIARRNTRFESLAMLVLDEADRMLDMGFLPDIRRVISALPHQRQTMMFSATFPQEIALLADNMMKSPQRVEIGRVARPADAVSQGVFTVDRAAKPELLKQLLSGKDVGPTIVFMRTKRSTDRLAKVLVRDGFSAEAIHGDQSQTKRLRAIDGFRAGKHSILVATDIAARGIDVQGVSHVVNYDVPATTDDYIHRIGRTARANATGHAITFVTPDDAEMLRDIERAIGRRIERRAWEGSVSVDDLHRTAGAPAAATRPSAQRTAPSHGRPQQPRPQQGRPQSTSSSQPRSARPAQHSTRPAAGNGSRPQQRTTSTTSSSTRRALSPRPPRQRSQG